LTGTLLTGTVNVVAGGCLVLGLFRRDLTRRGRWLLVLANLTVLGVLASAAVLVDDFERAARHAVYGKDVRVALQTDVQEVVLTGGDHGRPLDLFLDGRLRVSERDERRYHEALVHPAMDGPHARVLVLGGGDGLAARDVLRHRGVRRVDIVELDAAVVQLARHDSALAALNDHVYGDPRVHVTTGDSFDLLRRVHPGTYDVVIADLPDPGITASTKLYSQEFYGLARRALTERGRLVVHAGPVSSRRRVFWTVVSTVRAAGLRPVPYRVGGRASGFAAGPDRTAGTSRSPRDWGFVLAARGAAPAEPGLESDERAAERTRVPGLPASTLVHPRY